MTVGFHKSDTKVVGISTRHPKEKQTAHIYALAEKTYRHILDDQTFKLPEDAVEVFDEYVGPGYSLPTEGMEEAVTMFARLEGILLERLRLPATNIRMMPLSGQPLPECDIVLFESWASAGAPQN